MAEVLRVYFCLFATVLGVAPPSLVPPPVKPAGLPLQAVVAQMPGNTAGGIEVQATNVASAAELVPRFRGSPPRSQWNSAESGLKENQHAEPASSFSPPQMLSKYHTSTSSSTELAHSLGAFVLAVVVAAGAGLHWRRRRHQAMKNKDHAPEVSLSSSIVWSEQPKFAAAALASTKSFDPMDLAGLASFKSADNEVMYGQQALLEASRPLMINLQGGSAFAGAANSLSASRDSSAVTLQAGAGQYTGFVPDLQRRTLMNLVCVGVTVVPAGVMLGGVIWYIIPPAGGGGGGATLAGDINGNPVSLAGWMSSHKENERELVQGLKGEAFYIVTKADGIKDFAIGATCTHLGCVVPWNRAANKFCCPCHGSQYDENGKVVRGPAPLSLPLAHVQIQDGNIAVSPWPEQDFRTGLDPWWK